MRKLIRMAVLCATTIAFNIGATEPTLRPKPTTSTLTLNEEYIERFKDLAMFDQVTTGIPASIKLGQALVESQGGESELAVNANNHFGLKCRSCSEVEIYLKKDDERDKNGHLVYSKFQRFNSPEDSYAAHSRKLTTESRYWSLFSYERTDYRSWAHGLQKCGYATDKKYADNLIETIERYNLQRFDKPSYLVIPEIAGRVPPQYAADNTSVNVPYDSDPSAAKPQMPTKTVQIEATASKNQDKKAASGKKVAIQYCRESSYMSKEGEQMQFTLSEVTLEETNENVMPKNSASSKQTPVLSKPVQRKKEERLPK
jgi:hypothetical protein